MQTTHLTASQLLAMVENGQSDEAAALIQTLGRDKFLEFRRYTAKLDAAMDAYACSWHGAEYWCHGGTWPEEPMVAKAAA